MRVRVRVLIGYQLIWPVHLELICVIWISRDSIALAHRCSALGIFTRQYRYVVVVV